MVSRALDHGDMRSLYAAHVLRDRRYEPDRRQRIAYPRGGRRAPDLRALDEYRRSVAHSDPFRWQRRVIGALWSLGIPFLLAAGVVMLARQVVGTIR